MELTIKQRLFVLAYLGEADGNATAAARIAGYGQPQSVGPRLLANQRVQSLISRHCDQAAMSANEVLARLSEFASADIGEYIEEQPDGTVKMLLAKAKKAGRTRVIKKIKVTKKTFTSSRGDVEEEMTTELELHSPLVALDKLAQHHGLYRELKANDDDLEEKLRDAERAAGQAADPMPDGPGAVQRQGVVPPALPLSPEEVGESPG